MRGFCFFFHIIAGLVCFWRSSFFLVSFSALHRFFLSVGGQKDVRICLASVNLVGTLPLAAVMCVLYYDLATRWGGMELTILYTLTTLTTRMA